MNITVTGTYTLAADPTWKSLQLQEIYLECDTSVAPVVINLFEISKLNRFWNVKIYISDQSSNASVNNITINSAVTDTIDTDAITSKVIATDGANIALFIVSDDQWTTLANTILVAIPNFQQVYDISNQIQLTISQANGAVQYKNNLADQSSSTQEWLDFSDVVVASVDGNGLFQSNFLAIIDEYILPTVDGTVGQAMITDGAGLVTFQTITSNNIYNTDDTLTGNRIVSLDSNTLTFSGGNLGIGASPDANTRFDIRMQGIMAAHIGLRVRNFANTLNFVQINGDGTFHISGAGSPTANGFSYFSDGRVFMAKSGTNLIELNATTGQNRLYAPNNGWQITTGISQFQLLSSTTSFRVYQDTVQLTTTLQVGSGTNAVLIQKGTPPSVKKTDHAWLYVDDIVAGNAAYHLRCEDDAIIRLYQETTAIAAATFVSNSSGILNDSATFGGYTIGQIAAAMQSQGFLA